MPKNTANMAALERSLSLSSFVPHSQIMNEQKRWLSIVRRNIKEDLNHKSRINEATIFIVPKTQMRTSPNSYTPQHVSLGPNHCWRPELHDMEGYKIAAAKDVQQHLLSQGQGKGFQYVVDKFQEEHERNIRACYQRFIYFDDSTLVWVMAIDTAFLLEFLQEMYYKRVDEERLKIFERTDTDVLDDNVRSSAADDSVEIHVVDQSPGELNTLTKFPRADGHNYAGRGSTTTRNAILRDIVMLENQIPLFLLREMLKLRFSLSEESANDRLHSMLRAFHKKVCPFRHLKDLEKDKVSQRDHLLDYLYRSILPEDMKTSSVGDDMRDKESIKYTTSSQNLGDMATTLSGIGNKLDKVKCGGKLQFIVIGPIKLLVTLASRLLSQLPNKGSGSELSDGDKPPPEIDIPSATELSRAGVRLLPIDDDGNFSDINFNAKKAKFKLPVIRLDDNTEVVLRNLVAYEASKRRSLYFTRYTELMNGLIDTAEDVKLLKEKGIVKNHMKSEAEAADMWNGMGRFVKKKRVDRLDKVIKDVNTYYNGRWSIKVERFMRYYVYDSWQFLAFLATILLLLFETFDAFCSVYNCTTLFHFKYYATK